jgi:hypothetical protein
MYTYERFVAEANTFRQAICFGDELFVLDYFSKDFSEAL